METHHAHINREAMSVQLQQYSAQANPLRGFHLFAHLNAYYYAATSLVFYCWEGGTFSDLGKTTPIRAQELHERLLSYIWTQPQITMNTIVDILQSEPLSEGSLCVV